ncbi:SLC52A3 [Lepeophtheirus salmonis]|uniref:Riboflavin transporter n=1 Tax=Lepeophtheirus salmonis TaxID=72036 RepID=A0A7R8D2E8_LEPSM|nr:SLC52A3 [Lepeophtheirus salmonis]CAF3004612.1 SLC52A3 [Lepeophtheirus salmonis]
MGEGLSGFIPSIVALFQGIGQTKCEKLYNETTQEWVTSIVTEPPNFSVEIFFYFLFGMMLISLASFMMLDLSPFARSEKISESELRGVTAIWKFVSYSEFKHLSISFQMVYCLQFNHTRACLMLHF